MIDSINSRLNANGIDMFPSQHSKFRPALVLLALLFSATGQAADEDESPLEVPVEATAWERAFARTSGWTGGDVIGSIDLEDGRTLWVFGDSWIGDVVNGKHVPPSRLVNNAIAIHKSSPNRPWEPPDSSKIEFHWGANDANGTPTAWIVPSEGQTAGAAPGKGDWYWPTGGGIVVAGPNQTKCLVLFLFRVRRGDRPGSVMNFRVTGTAMAVIDNVGDDVTMWHVRQIAIPGNDVDEPAQGKGPVLTTHWGMAVCKTPSGEAAGHYDFFIYGVRSGEPLNSRLVVARASADNVDRFNEWRFYAGDGKWSERSAEAKPVGDRMVSEFSVEPVTRNGETRFLLVQSEPLFGNRILARSAPRPEGPWSEPVPIYTVSEIEGKKSMFTYAAKGHVSLSHPREILVTYVINSHAFKEIVNDATLYRPRFVRVPLHVTMPD